jgi:hypothetical protein
MGLLVYTFNEAAGRGVLEFIHPPDVLQMVLSPDRAHLMVRREYGLQPIEVYNLDTGVLEKTYIPAEPDYEGRQLLAYNAAGDQIITDFERLDARTGEVIERDVLFTGGFSVISSRKTAKAGDDYRTDWRVRYRNRADLARAVNLRAILSTSRRTVTASDSLRQRSR